MGGDNLLQLLDCRHPLSSVRQTAGLVSSADVLQTYAQQTIGRLRKKNGLVPPRARIQQKTRRQHCRCREGFSVYFLTCMSTVTLRSWNNAALEPLRSECS